MDEDQWRGWRTQHRSQADLDRMAWRERENYELQIIREWDSQPGAHWSGM